MVRTIRHDSNIRYQNLNIKLFEYYRNNSKFIKINILNIIYLCWLVVKITSYANQSYHMNSILVSLSSCFDSVFNKTMASRVIKHYMLCLWQFCQYKNYLSKYQSYRLITAPLSPILRPKQNLWILELQILSCSSGENGRI